MDEFYDTLGENGNKRVTKINIWELVGQRERGDTRTESHGPLGILYLGGTMTVTTPKTDYEEGTKD